MKKSLAPSPSFCHGHHKLHLGDVVLLVCLQLVKPITPLVTILTIALNRALVWFFPCRSNQLAYWVVQSDRACSNRKNVHRRRLFNQQRKPQTVEACTIEDMQNRRPKDKTKLPNTCARFLQREDAGNVRNDVILHCCISQLFLPSWAALLPFFSVIDHSATLRVLNLIPLPPQ